MWSNVPFEARLALEYMQTSGERNATRLASLVDHYCTTNAIIEPETRAYIQNAALQAARKIPGFTD